MAIEWTASAEKHLPKEDGLHAIQNRIAFIRDFDISRDGTGAVVDLVIGPARDGSPLEVMMHRTPPNEVLVFHVMPLRPKIVKLAQEVVSQSRKEN